MPWSAKTVYLPTPLYYIDEFIACICWLLTMVFLMLSLMAKIEACATKKEVTEHWETRPMRTYFHWTQIETSIARVTLFSQSSACSTKLSHSQP